VSYDFRPAKRESLPLLLGLAGGTGSGKTFSALRLARGIAGGEPFAIIDTENGRAKFYADAFPEMRHTDITAPFRPAKYADAIQAADAAGFPVVLVDSGSHEWAGDGGCLDWHDDLMGGDQKKNLSAWIEPKREHKKMVTRLLQVKAHVIICFRAEPKVEAIREGGQTKIIAKPSLTGLDGWIPISEKMLPYELTASFLLMADHPGVPKPIKLPGDLAPFVPLDQPISEETGKRLAEWARGGSALSTGAAPGDAAAPAESASANGAVEPLTSPQFTAKLRTVTLDPETFKATGKRLFPGRAPNTLSDEERGQFWAALSTEAGVRSPPSEAPASSPEQEPLPVSETA
jgi:hypothetical protein